MTRGVYITFEGCECSGKSTQLTILGDRLRAVGRSIIKTKQPGGTEIGVEIRATLLKQGRTEPMTPKTESLLFWADRIQQYTTLVWPALERGTDVLGDRDFDSSHAYQVSARGLSQDWMDEMQYAVIGDFKPHLTLLYDAPIEVLIPRILERNARLGIESRFDEEPEDFHAKVRHGFLERARREPDRFIIIDAYRPGLAPEDAIQEIADETFAIVRQRFGF